MGPASEIAIWIVSDPTVHVEIEGSGLGDWFGGVRAATLELRQLDRDHALFADDQMLLELSYDPSKDVLRLRPWPHPSDYEMRRVNAQP